MPSFCGVRMPDVGTLRGKSIEKRTYILQKYAKKVDGKAREGLDTKEALEFVKIWKPAFGDLKLLQSQPEADGRRTLKLSVGYYTCGKCRLNFDEKDLKSHCPEGIMCPKCGELVVKTGGEPVVDKPAEPVAPPQAEAGSP